MKQWINQNLLEARAELEKWRLNRRVHVLAKVDHVEIGASHLVLGLNVGWHNTTTDPIAIIEIQVMLYRRNDEELLLHLLPLERFARVIGVRAIDRTPLSQFDLPPKETHTENIRFISHARFDIPPGTYIVDIQVRDTNHNSYTRRTKIDIENKMKYRLSEEWTEPIRKN